MWNQKKNEQEFDDRQLVYQLPRYDSSVEGTSVGPVRKNETRVPEIFKKGIVNGSSMSSGTILLRCPMYQQKLSCAIQLNSIIKIETNPQTIKNRKLLFGISKLKESPSRCRR